MDRIAAIKGREILNAKGRPTVEAQLITERGIRVTASVPSGTSRGKYEAFELYDGETRHNGRGARKAAENISTEICRALAGMDVADQEAIDRTLCRLDGTPDKHRLGGNALLAASVAAALGTDGLAVLLRNHGSLCCGRDLPAAMTAAAYVEEAAQVAYYASALGRFTPLGEADIRACKEMLAAGRAV